MVSNPKAITWDPLPAQGSPIESGPHYALENWRPLRYFNMYRATLSGLIITLAFFGIAPRYFGQTNSDLFWITAIAYFAFSVLCSVSIQLRWGNFQVQVVAQVFGDIIAITLMMHASGGVVSGFGTLLVVAIAGGSILTEGRIAILYAATASLAVLFQQIYAWLFIRFPARPIAKPVCWVSLSLPPPFSRTCWPSVSARVRRWRRNAVSTWLIWRS